MASNSFVCMVYCTYMYFEIIRQKNMCIVTLCLILQSAQCCTSQAQDHTLDSERSSVRKSIFIITDKIHLKQYYIAFFLFESKNKKIIAILSRFQGRFHVLVDSRHSFFVSSGFVVVDRRHS